MRNQAGEEAIVELEERFDDVIATLREMLDVGGGDPLAEVVCAAIIVRLHQALKRELQLAATASQLGPGAVDAYVEDTAALLDPTPAPPTGEVWN